MSFSDVYLVTDKLSVASEADVRAAEAQLGASFPSGYKEFITTLGKGEYCGFVDVFVPSEVEKNQIKEFSHSWKEGETGLSSNQLAETILLGTSTGGDWILFHPDVLNAVYVLPSEEQVVCKVGASLDDALTWLYSPSGKPRFCYFDSGIDQKSAPVPLKINLTYDEFRGWLLGLKRHDYIEETAIQDETSQDMTFALLQNDRLQMAEPDEGKHFMMFFKCFFGFVVCYTDMFNRLNIAMKYDAERDDGTAQTIISYLQSKAE